MTVCFFFLPCTLQFFWLFAITVPSIEDECVISRIPHSIAGYLMNSVSSNVEGMEKSDTDVMTCYRPIQLKEIKYDHAHNVTNMQTVKHSF